MKLNLLLFICLTVSLLSFSQEIKRVEISGKIVVNSEDLENVTIYNTSSNKGTLTDEDGKFKIEVALFDILEVRALQFQDFTVTIDKNIIDSKKATIFLVEKVNKLNEVLILPYDLTGNLVVDMESVRTFNPNLDAIYFGIGDISAYEFPDDYKSEVENIAARQPNDIRYQMDGVALVGLLLKPLFKSKKDKKTKEIEKVNEIQSTSLRDYYSTRFIVDNFKIPEDKVNDFVAYVESHDLDYSLLKKGKEMDFLEFLTQKSDEFLKSESGKN
ncbi:carboxypeptidase-like regulatory domain-containing protein [Subsaxibacter sp. CAU 1640]|uniref:carboxypeptidase-like regulatory domain-containing protein n=1 Tax=Subsaxibacter sp. CAU 1640 TaxID=2933271 RepID=UPI002002D3B8|nr:carboxypeptidase-like regulatory domain-containing protein [Subsaxibacter sp. CAU 1640]MCK7590173.1 carboxypeptidase-like regulatory domain-containing protein [Subsaxibacter sp. CAU 1640]